MSLSPKSRRSILKRVSEADQTKNLSKKKISTQEMMKLDNTESRDLSFEKNIFLARNLTFTKIGVCFIPPKEDSVIVAQSKVPKDKIGKSKKPDYRLLLRKDADSSSVLIIGDKLLSRGFKEELESIGKVKSQTNLTCKTSDNPTLEEIQGADFFVFLIQMEKCYSISEIRPKLVAVYEHVKCLSFRCVFVGISSPLGPYANAVPLEDYHNLMIEFQIPSFTYCILKKERKFHVLSSIYSTIVSGCHGDASDPLIGCHRNTSDPLIGWGLSCPIHAQDTLLT